MSAFERFMEAWGLVTMDLMRSASWWRRALGTVIGAVAVCLMMHLMAFWWLLNAAKYWWRAAVSLVRR